MHNQTRLVFYCAFLCILVGSTFAVLTSEDEDRVIGFHRLLRAAYNLPELLYSNPLAIEAQQWADFCQSGPSGNKQYGENSAMDVDLNFVTILSTWGSQGEYWNCATDECAEAGEGCLNYKQMIWGNTTHVGCGFKDCGVENVIICYYEPAGTPATARPFPVSTCTASEPTSEPTAATPTTPSAVPKSSTAGQVALIAPLYLLLLL